METSAAKQQALSLGQIARIVPPGENARDRSIINGSTLPGQSSAWSLHLRQVPIAAREER
jgi:hypothetical protein